MEKSIHSAQYAVLLRLLKQARVDAGISQVQLAKSLSETQSFISKCERGERRLDVIELRSFCRALNVEFADFIKRLERRLPATQAKGGARHRVDA